MTTTGRDYTVDEVAQYETTSRVVASLLNEELIRATARHSPVASGPRRGLLLQSYKASEAENQVWIALGEEDNFSRTADGITYHPADFRLPVLVRAPAASEFRRETKPERVAEALRPLLNVDQLQEAAWQSILAQLKNSSENQAAWFSWSQKQERPTLESRALAWEQALVTGHPSHPMHRSCVSTQPLEQLLPKDAPSLLQPPMSIIALDSSETRISGPFRDLIKPLLDNFDTFSGTNEVLLPCLSRQVPMILERFKTGRVVVQDAYIAEAQASIRTVTVPKQYGFEWHLKTALACTITSALRTISPWTACVGPELSAIFRDLIPEDTWVCDEVASITGSQDDYDTAKMLSCVLREDLEPRADSLNQALIIAAALAERPYNSDECYAALTFDLHTPLQKMTWLTSYAEKLIDSILTPAVESGICLEAHGQNMLVRVDRDTKRVVGFGVRDLGGVKCHMPTLRKQGYYLPTALPGSFVTGEKEEECWSIIQHTLVQNHLHHLIRRLRLPSGDSWAMVRECLNAFFEKVPRTEQNERFKEFLFRSTIPNKAFLRMKMEGLYRDYKHSEVPNVLLST